MTVGISTPSFFSMRVSSRAHYSLRMMTEFAKAYGEGPLSLAEVARVEHLPLAYLEQLAAQLRRGGLIESTRGVHGGYALTQPPDRVSVLDILSIVEGEVAPVECLTHEYAGDCARDADCASRGLWDRLKVSIEAVLRETSLTSLIGDHSLLTNLTPLPEMTPLPMASGHAVVHPLNEAAHA